MQNKLVLIKVNMKIEVKPLTNNPNKEYQEYKKWFYEKMYSGHRNIKWPDPFKVSSAVAHEMHKKILLENMRWKII